MRKLKQILAGFLAMNLTISTAPAGIVNVRASEEYSSDSIYEETYAEEQSVQTYAEETASPEQAASETEAVYYDTDVAMEAEETPDEGTSVTDSTTNVENTAAAPISEEVIPIETPNSTEVVDIPTSESTTESIFTTENASTIESSESQESVESSSSDIENTSASAEDESNKEELSSEEESSSEEEQTEETETEEENEVAKQTTDYVVTKANLTLEQFKNYKEINGEKTITIESVQELILLSNCNQSELQNVTIEFNSSGNADITEKNKIEKDTDLSEYLKSLDTTAVVSNSEEQTKDELAEDSTSEVQQDTEVDKQDDAQNDDTVQDGKIVAGEDFVFNGIGSAAAPFNGKITGQQFSWTIDRPFFGGLSSTAVFYPENENYKLILRWSGDGTKSMIAEVYQLDPPASTDENASGNSQRTHDLSSVDVSLGEGATAMGSLIGTVKAASGCKNDILNIGNVCSYTGATVTASSSSGNSGLICNVLESGNIRINNEYEFPSNGYTVKTTATYSENETSAAGNAGGVIGVMKTGTILYIAKSISITGTTVDASGNTGGLVGLLDEGAKIVTEEGAMVALTSQAITAIKSAGGLVGLMKKGSAVVTGSNAGITLSKPEIKGAVAGGIAGTAEDVIFADNDMQSKITVTTSTVTGNISGASAGGFIGNYILNADNLENAAANLQFPNQIVIDTPTLTVNQSSTGLAGGYFGLLDLEGKLTYTIGNADDAEKTKIEPTYANCSAEASGAIAGQVVSSDIASTLAIQNIEVTVTNNSGQGIKYHGGLIGEVGNSNGSQSVYLQVSNADIKVQNPCAQDDGENKGFGFGGITGFLTQGSILKLMDTITISTSGDNINQGGGLVGYADRSVINLSGTTDLSDAKYEKGSGKYTFYNSTTGIRRGPKTGWLVGKQESALIYANGDGNGNGWTYIRGIEDTSDKVAMNDIGNYGQVIRLHSDESKSQLSNNLIEIGSDHAIAYNTENPVVLNGNQIEINSVDAFALLSIVWNTRGYFGGITGISSTDFDTTSPKTKNIILYANIDLTGSGITGLSRDSYDGNDKRRDTYTGNFNGNKHIIKLAIGETFGYKQDDKTKLASDGDDGYGEVISAGPYYHGRQGLFAAVGNGAVIQNLTIDGSISISSAGIDILAGGIAGEIQDDASHEIKIKNVTVKETITADCATSQLLMVGGFLGGSYGSNNKLTLEKGKTEDERNTASAAIVMVECEETSGIQFNAGEIIGEVGESKFTLEANCLTVGGSITTEAKDRAYVGGLIGVIKGKDETPHYINVNDIIFDGFKLNAQDAREICGGLFGSIWDNVEVCFNKDKTATGGLNVKNTTAINAQNAEYVGGLAYRSNGKWEINAYGINLESLTINAGKDVGLLVCRGEYATDKIAKDDKRLHGALYLSTTEHWNTSYQIDSDKVNITTSDAGIFDEFVAYTTSKSETYTGSEVLTAKNIIENNINGVISIATREEGGVRVGVDVNACTTYQNRTSYGTTHQTNAYSRYYYDLDQCCADSKSSKNGKIDTPQELLLWSVYKYAGDNIKNYFAANSDITTRGEENTPWIIEASTANDGKLDMSKYSYYPIQYKDSSDGGVTIQKTEIIFNNEQIEKEETTAPTNKSTQGTSDNHTQHYTMHCGLFLTYRIGTLNVDTVTFSGSIGKVNNGTSGVLVADMASGGEDSNGSYSIGINISNIILNGLKVNNCGDDYAPLLINGIGYWPYNNYTYGYVALSVTGVKINENNYEMGTAAGSSLIGYVGSNTAKAITMSFSKIILPDKKADGNSTGIFSHATLLESFAYANDDNASGGTYNFNLEEDWTGNTHTHNVTYGYEITHTIEFKDSQKWYYNEDINGDDKKGLVYEDATHRYDFDSKDYLPYVCNSYDKDSCKHEIKVNQRVTDILEGCGTYGHPYKITNAKEMNILAEYMASTQPRAEWRVKITKNQETVHTANSDDYTSASDAIYEYDSTSNSWIQVERDENNNWKRVEGDIALTNAFMHDYLRNAYYDIQGKDNSSDNEATEVNSESTSATEPTLVLNDFKGFGTYTYPFRGVITSKNRTNIILEGDEVGNGLIPYSYGSVVKDLTVTYKNGSKTLKFTGSTNYYPSVCFGGVIGCVLAGDNIIDNVTVNIESNWNLTLEGEKKHLIQVGGYVGSICGGGVIFRNMKNKAGLTDSAILNSSTEISVGEGALYSLYVNPYVGRVLDGFAFCESSSDEKVLNNTNKNYEINTINSTATGSNSSIGESTDAENTVTVKNAQGLLILSAIVNSGAGSGGISNAYSKMGASVGQEVRYSTTSNTDTNTTTTYSFGGKYGKVRNASYGSATSADAALSITEDMRLPGTENFPYLIRKYCAENVREKVFGISNNSKIEIALSENGNFNMAGYGNGYQGIGARYVSNAVRGHGSEESTPINHPEGIIPILKNFNGNGNIVTMSVQVSEYTDDDFHAASVGGIFNILQVSGDGKISNLIINQNETKNEAEVRTSPGVSFTYYGSNGQPASVSESDFHRYKDVGVGGLAGSLVGYTGEDANRDITIENIQLGNLTVESPASAGGLFGNTGKPVFLVTDENKNVETIDRTNGSDIAVLLQPKDSQIAYGIAFNACNYANLTVTGKYAAGGFAGYIGNKGQNPRSTVNENDFEETLTEEQKKVGQNSIITASATGASSDSSCAGGLFGYVGTRMFINMTDTGDKKTNPLILEGVTVTAGTAVGGCIGYINGKCYGIHNVTIQGTTEKKLITLLTETLEGKFYSGGIVGYAQGEGQGWTENWTYAGGFIECTVSGIEINGTAHADKHDYLGAGKIKTNYIAGGIVGFVGGGITRIDTCTVNSSKVYGSVAGGITGQTDSKMEFISCTVTGTSEDSRTEMKGFSTAGGILGFWTGGQTATIQNSKLQYLEVQGQDWGVAAWIGDADGGGVGTLYLFNSFAQNCKVTASGGRWPCVGGITGNLRNTIKASNILFSNITLTSTGGKGLLFGSVTSDNIAVNIAGISIQNIPDANKDWNLTGGGSVSSSNDYIAFADYSGTALSKLNSTTSEEEESKTILLDDVEEVAPYVTTSPMSTFSVSVSGTDAVKVDKYLYGDGAYWTSVKSDGVEAKVIWDNKDKKELGNYAYKNITNTSTDSVSSFAFGSVISTYNENQTTKVDTNMDFPVVRLSNGDADIVKDYLNILTNGAFSAANNMNKKGEVHVTAKAEVYTYDVENQTFVKNDLETPAFQALTGATNKITFSTTTDYDNDKNRFTLLTVTFTEENADGKKYNYNVFVPVLVRRMLEMDFIATLTYGTDFNKSDYTSLKNHVLESFGSSITGYLTYIYNSDKDGIYTDYGWQSYINAGGNLTDMKKSIKFTTSLPKGTQLTLVDEASKKAYYYTATGEEEYKDSGIAIPLGDFVDSSGKLSYQEPSISELIGAVASDKGDNLFFVKVKEDGSPIDDDSAEQDKEYPNPTIRIKTDSGYEYYRLADSTEKGKYSITVDESKLKKTKTVGKTEIEISEVKENYYLVITVPADSKSEALNGSIQTTIVSNIPNNMSYQMRHDGKVDGHLDTASTYQLSNGYQQSLVEIGNDGYSKKITTADSTMKIKVKDKIIFPKAQAYQPVDQLYLRFVGGMQKTVNNADGTSSTSAEQFPSGTTGVAKFSVYTENNGSNTYYKYNVTNSKWEQITDSSDTVAVSYTWTSDGGVMELPLATKQPQAQETTDFISLQEIRTIVKNATAGDNCTFYVELNIEVTIPAAGLDVIPETQIGTYDSLSEYTKLTCFAQLSTVPQNLTYSSNRASLNKMTTSYYRDVPAGATLTYDADSIDQLGINLLDLRYLDAAKEKSLIDTTAIYDLSSMRNLESTLANSSGIRFTLTLCQKKADSVTEDYGSALGDAENKYLNVELKSENSGSISYSGGTWTWTVPKDSYYSTNGLVEDGSVFKNGRLTQLIQLKVNIKPSEIYYSNYKVVLTAEILDSKGNIVVNSNLNDYIIYTFVKIKPEFVEE